MQAPTFSVFLCGSDLFHSAELCHTVSILFAHFRLILHSVHSFESLRNEDPIGALDAENVKSRLSAGS